MSDGDTGTTLEAAAARLAESIDALEAHIARLKADRADADRRIAALEADNAELRRLKDAVADKLDKSIERIDRMMAGAD